MKVAIIGTRGIPNFYGGFEQFAEYFSTYLAAKGHEVYVYCPHNHPYKEELFSGVKLVRCFDPEYRIGTAGQFVYDLNCILHTRRLRPDVILNLGYTSSAVFMRLFRKKTPVVTNMDGLEWKRSKYGRLTQKFLRYSEQLAVKHSDVLISDSAGIQSYISRQYSQPSTYIAYGADVIQQTPDAKLLDTFLAEPFRYHLLIARMEPENNLETVLEGICRSGSSYPTIVIGNYTNDYGNYLFNKYNGKTGITFIGPYYDIEKLNALRYYCRIYFHGHSVGGTNPSLLEAMASYAFICAHRNEFNQGVLGQQALYFSASSDVQAIVGSTVAEAQRKEMIAANAEKIKTEYNWELINSQYETTLLNAITSHK